MTVDHRTAVAGRERRTTVHTVLTGLAVRHGIPLTEDQAALLADGLVRALPTTRPVRPRRRAALTSKPGATPKDARRLAARLERTWPAGGAR